MSERASIDGPFLVTGASRGIGRAVAERLLSRGVRIGAVGRDERALIELAETAPSQVVIMPGDLRGAESRTQVARTAKDALGTLQGVVFAAGIARHEPFATLQEEALRETFEVNFFAPALLARDLAPLIRDGGSITLVSSTLANRPAENAASYAASKGALNALTLAMAVELAPRVRVNAVAPGIVDTAMVRNVRLAPGESPPTGAELAKRLASQREEMNRMHLLRRMGESDEVARAVEHLIRSDWSTGTILTLDGGLSLGG